MNSRLDELRAGVTEAGFRPTVLAPVMWAIRRALWPIIRQYHFYHAEQVVAVEDALGNLTHQKNELIDEIAKTTVVLVKLRTDVAALVNRHSILARDSTDLRTQVGGIQESLSVLAKQVEGLAQGQTALAGDLVRETSQLSHAMGIVERHLGERLDQNLAESQQQARLESLDDRTRLRLTSSTEGIFIVKAGDLISDSITENGVWDAHVVAAMDEVASERKGLAIDVGANIGFHTVAMAKRFPRVLSFEPNAFNYQLLSANIALNSHGSHGNVECIHGALYSHETQVSLAEDQQQDIPVPLSVDGSFDGLGALNLGAYSFAERGTGLLPVQAKTLDSYQLTDVAFIKIDVQGADGEVLAGARETLRTSHPVVVFEWEEHLSRNYGVSLQAAVADLEALGYGIEVLKRTNEKQVDFIARWR